MLTQKKTLQRVLNIARFNWHYHIVALAIFFLMLLIKPFISTSLKTVWSVLQVAVILFPLASLLVSVYIYDFSKLYRFDWINKAEMQHCETIVNINAGSDKSSDLLKSLFPASTVHVLDIYNPEQQTGRFIIRTRKPPPRLPETIQVNSNRLPLPSELAENIFLVFSAHEVRNEKDRTVFFKELHRTLSYGGKIIIVEHMRDLNNFLAYNIAFFHFFSRPSWLRVFKAANLNVTQEQKITPFVTVFTLEKN